MAADINVRAKPARYCNGIGFAGHFQTGNGPDYILLRRIYLSTGQLVAGSLTKPLLNEASDAEISHYRVLATEEIRAVRASCLQLIVLAPIVLKSLGKRCEYFSKPDS